jgi:hypothetical protein
MEPAAAADCERILQSWWGQPVNTVTAAAFIVAGALVWFHRRDSATGALVASIGIGSIAFHGPMPVWGEFVHDVSIVLTMVWVLLVETKRTRLWPWGFALAAATSVTPTVADPVQAVLAVGVLAVVALPKEQRTQRLRSITVLALGGVVGTLSRTGGPWCASDSLWQGHGVWHLAAAVSLAVWGLAIRPCVGGGPKPNAISGAK